MDHRFLLLPVASVVLSAPALAVTYLTIEQAQAVMFPGAAFTEDFRTLSKEQIAAIEKASGVNVRERRLKVWRVSTGGWFILDEVVGKHEFIPFALALDKDGAVKGVEILEYHEAYGDEVRLPAWRAQFLGKRHGAKLKLTDDIKNISGATLSCRHMTDGVKRLLATYALVLAPAGG
jgi:Na+-translocating ferredoxin:NAD+ oxidoreductase RnfG subunit